VHRHRVPATTLARLDALRATGQVSVLAARLLRCRNENGIAALDLRPRHSEQVMTREADTVVNCTGPDGDVRRSRSPLIRDLLVRGLVRPSALGLGWTTAVDGRLIAASGSPSPFIYYVGPFARGQCWEATAVPELRRHVDRVTSAIEGTLQLGRTRLSHTAMSAISSGHTACGIGYARHSTL